MARDAIIDDTQDSVITYHGNWNVSTKPLNFASPEYNGTFHSTNDPNASAVITVQGSTYFNVFGTIDQPASKGLPGSIWTWDGGDPVTITGAKDLTPELRNRTDTISHVEIYSLTKPAVGTHTLVLNVTGVSPTGPTFYLDFIVAQIETALDVEHVIVDNNNTNWIYPEWTNGTSPSAYRENVSLPPDGGGTAILGFHGTEITVMGNIDTTAPGDTTIALVQIDGGTVQTILASDVPTMTPTATASGSTPTTPLLYQNVEIFKTTGLRDQSTKQHTITISAPPQVASVWALDYVIYGPSSGTGSSTATASSGSASLASSSSTSTSNSSKAAVIGGAVGGIIGLLAVMGAIWFLYRRSKQRREAESRAVSPYTLKNHVNPSTRSFNGGSEGRGRRQPYQEQDGGVRLAIGEDEDEDEEAPQSALPPVYAAY